MFFERNLTARVIDHLGVISAPDGSIRGQAPAGIHVGVAEVRVTRALQCAPSPLPLSQSARGSRE
jgi:hypothetical protein